MPRRWTILIVPHGTDSPKSYELGERRVRMLIGVAVAVVLLIGAAAAVLFTPWASPSARLAASENARLRQELASIDSRLQALVDTIAAIEQQDQRIRTLAGIDPDTTGEVAEKEVATVGAAAEAAATLGATTASRLQPIGIAPERSPRFASKPFLGRLGFGGNRPDLEGMIRRATELSASFRAVSDTLALHAERMANLPSIMPTAGWLTSQFSRSRFHPILHTSRAHEGVDVVAPMGTPIVAPAAGRVIKAGREQGYGLMVQIDHGNGLVTIYAHASKIVVQVGQRV
ncbi:MAG: M23 family metallopeptidase, partial [Gemmatimonadaceae bacterium]|nr:M23 family metallopeptidase [Gemmatimonadaceae bacterium]